MKIAMITTWFPPIIVGSGNRFYELGKRLSRKHEIDVYTVGVKGHAREEAMEGMRIHRYGMFNISKSDSIEGNYHLLKLKFGFEVLRKLSRNFDIIDGNIVSKVIPYAAYPVSKISDASLILTWHEIWHIQNFEALNPMLALPAFFIEFPIPRLVDVNIAVSETTERKLVELLKVTPNKIVVIPNGVDVEKISGISAEKKYGRILYAGRLESHKCVDKLIFAYKRLKMVYSDIELIIVGRGPKKEYLQKLSRRLNLDVRFYEPLPYDKLIELMKSAWILVLSSIREGQGIVLLEAMAAGTPPIAVNAEGSAVRDVIKNNYNGLLIPQANMEEGIEKAIRKLLTDGDLHASLRKNGLQFVKKYDWDRIAAMVSDLYERVAGER